MTQSSVATHPRAQLLNQQAQSERWPYTRVMDWLQRADSSPEDLSALPTVDFTVTKEASESLSLRAAPNEWVEAEHNLTVHKDSHQHLAYISCGDGVIDARLHLEVEAGAVLDLVRINQLSAQGTSFENLQITVAEDAVVRIQDFNLEQGLSHVNLQVALLGQRSQVHLNSLSLLAGRSRAVLHADIAHRAESAISRLEFRNAVAGRSRRSVTGMVRVTPDGQHTDSAQICRSLLLSPRAAADMRPELEIYADQVACAHGATCGELDESALHYLRSRGLDLLTARRLLLESFALPMLSDVPEHFAAELESACQTSLNRLGEELSRSNEDTSR